MLDPGRYFAEAIYFLQYTLAQILWAANRATLSIAVIAESINTWVTENVGYFVQLLVNGLSAPLGGMFILALTALGFWYTLNNIAPTNRWVDPSKLFTYGLIAFFFFSSPIVVIDMIEDLRQSLNAGIDQTLIDGAAGDIFDANMNGTDTGLPAAIPDVNSDGVVGSFDLAAAFMLVANIDELDSNEFPVDFETTYFPFGDPSGIDLSDEADQELAKALASDGIERLFFALFAIPTAIAEHFLRLSLTGVAIFLYLGVPFAMLFAFFLYTQAFMMAYLRQFLNLLIETLMSVIIAAIMIGLLAASAVQGIGLYLGASIITLIVLLWRIKSALKLAAAAFDLFGGAMLTGGVGGMEVVRMGRKALTGSAALAGAALTGGATLAAGGTVLATAAAVRADGRSEGAYLGLDPNKTEGRVRQLKTIAGYTLGKSATARHAIENTHEARTLVRNFRDGEVQPYEPDMLDYLRAGSTMSSFGSSPWMAMRFSPSLRTAYDQIGGRRNGGQQHSDHDDTYDETGEPISADESPSANGRSASNQHRSSPPDDDINSLWRDEPATTRQQAYLSQLGVSVSEELTRGQASDLITQNRQSQRQQVDSSGSNGTHSQPPTSNQELLHRFASLEQALAALTTALTQPEGMSQGRNRPEMDEPNEPANGSLPIWLQPDETPVNPQTGETGNVNLDDNDPVQNVNIVGAAPDLDRDGREDKYETVQTQPDSTPSAPMGTIRLEPYQESRRQVIHDTVERLSDPHSANGQAAHKTLLLYAGQHNTSLIEQAVAQHTVEAVQTATTATADLVTLYRQQGLSDAQQLTAFQSGEATTAIRETTDTPLSDEQLAAVADMVLLPQRRLTRTELATVIGQEVAAGATNEKAVIQAIGSPIGFGRQTGNVRGVMAGAQAMNLSPTELARLAELIQDGLREAVQTELSSRGYQSELVRAFVSDMAALPSSLVLPQSTAVLPPAELGEDND